MVKLGTAVKSLASAWRAPPAAATDMVMTAGPSKRKLVSA